MQANEIDSCIYRHRSPCWFDRSVSVFVCVCVRMCLWVMGVCDVSELRTKRPTKPKKANRQPKTNLDSDRERESENEITKDKHKKNTLLYPLFPLRDYRVLREG